MIRALMRKGVFLCHCQVEGDVLRVGLLVLEKPMSGVVAVFDRDDEAHQLTVELPDNQAIALTDVELKIVQNGNLEHEHSETAG